MADVGQMAPLELGGKLSKAEFFSCLFSSEFLELFLENVNGDENETLNNPKEQKCNGIGEFEAIKSGARASLGGNQ